MREKHTKKIAVVYSDTAQGFEVDLNQKMEELAEYHPSLEFNMSKGHCAYLLYEVTEQVAESIKDEYELRGEKHKCIECPFLERDGDMRKKHFPCRMDTRRGVGEYCCNYFYKKLEAGEIKL